MKQSEVLQKELGSRGTDEGMKEELKMLRAPAVISNVHQISDVVQEDARNASVHSDYEDCVNVTSNLVHKSFLTSLKI